MALREPVAAFLANGPLPDEDQDVETIQRAENLLAAIPSPVTDEEAHALFDAFGADDSFGLAWTLLHLIETAPGAQSTAYPASYNPWVQLLRQRIENASGARNHEH